MSPPSPGRPTSWSCTVASTRRGWRWSAPSAVAIGRDELAFCQYYLGELAWGGGALEEARAHYERGLAAAPGDPALLQGRAKVLAATGRVDEAITAYDRLTQRVPLPQYLLEYGELLESAGRLPDARTQYRLLGEQQRLDAAQGSADDVTAALLAADHGDPAEAVRLAEAEWSRRQSIFSAEALAWALHAAGRDAEALPLIEQAGALGRRDATVDYRRGMILAALSRRRGSDRRGDRRAGRGAGHQPALLPAARAHRPADPGDPARCHDDPLVRAAGRAARALRRFPGDRAGARSWPAARPRIRWATSR